MSDERRKKPAYWAEEGNFSHVQLEPGISKAYKLHRDEEDGGLYVVEEDGERTYIVFS